MSDTNTARIAEELNIRPQQVTATIRLLDEGGTVPFISRYRKEMTGSLDEVAIGHIRDRIEQLRELDKRRESILATIEEQGKLSDELKASIMAAETMAELEDLYLPYKPKRKTRATMAREKGLEPLAEQLFSQTEGVDIAQLATSFIDLEKGVASLEDALAGARDIIAEQINEDQEARKEIRKLFERNGQLMAKVIPGKEEEGQKYKDYFDWSEPMAKAPSHRVLAMRRAEKEGFISLDCTPEEADAVEILRKKFVKVVSPAGEQVWLAAKDAYKRLLKPSMETEIRLAAKQRADQEAIQVFADNLRQLLLAAPLGQKITLAIDPSFRTGCKMVALDRQGKFLHYEAIYPNAPQNRTTEAAATVRKLVEKFKIEAIAIGNGTASRETERFIHSLKLPKVLVLMVNESGASVYSASAVAREEFPDHDLTVRGAVSIGRRLMDPLAELVKIDPKSIGVGQYQHDVDQNALKKSLDDTVSSCVNAVGVEVNTASKELLTYVSGLGPALAQNIVAYRNEKGPFKSRAALKKVPRLGDKAFEQCAGFLRIQDGKHPLDKSAVHPESYPIVERMAKDVDCTVADLMGSEEMRRKLKLEKYVDEKVGLPTLHDILAELAKPGRDPREQFEAFQFAEGIEHPEDLKIGMKLPGIVTNITDFGAFVDVGVHQDGLVHLSQLADRFVKHPSEAVKVQQQVEVTVLEVDLKRKRIALSMKTGQESPAPGRSPSKKKSQKAEPSMADKLNMLKSKFGK